MAMLNYSSRSFKYLKFSNLLSHVKFNNVTSLSSCGQTTFFVNFSLKMQEEKEITEGSAKIKTGGNVFYNPVQEFNRDLSISVVKTYAKLNKLEELTVLDALSATGLRAIRYAKELDNIKNVIANDISAKAIKDIEQNIALNNVENIVKANNSDAKLLMYQHSKSNQFDVVDLDPYGTPSIFLDSAVQSVKNGGLLLVTATDMAVLAGNSPETCYSKYEALSLKIKCCHEFAIRILLRCIESHANRYGKYIEPLLSISADFYIRVFVKIHTGAFKCKFSVGKLSHVFLCPNCGYFMLNSLGKFTNKFHFTPPIDTSKCKHCDGTLRMGGPIWSERIHDIDFVREILNVIPKELKTYRRIEGILTMIQEELKDVPLYYVLDHLCSVLHLQTPSMTDFRSALLNAGYEVSYSHANKNSVKTNADLDVLYDILRCWEKKHPVSKKRLTNDVVVQRILSKQIEKEYSFTHHKDAVPSSKKGNALRFQENPTPFWGPGFKGHAMVGQEQMTKKHKNQGKRKRTEDSL